MYFQAGNSSMRYGYGDVLKRHVDQEKTASIYANGYGEKNAGRKKHASQEYMYKMFHLLKFHLGNFVFPGSVRTSFMTLRLLIPQ